MLVTMLIMSHNASWKAKKVVHMAAKNKQNSVYMSRLGGKRSFSQEPGSGGHVLSQSCKFTIMTIVV